MYLIDNFRISLLLSFLSTGWVGSSLRSSAKAPLTFCWRNLSRWLENTFLPVSGVDALIFAPFASSFRKSCNTFDPCVDDWILLVIIGVFLPKLKLTLGCCRKALDFGFAGFLILLRALSFVGGVSITDSSLSVTAMIFFSLFSLFAFPLPCQHTSRYSRQKMVTYQKKVTRQTWPPLPPKSPPDQKNLPWRFLHPIENFLPDHFAASTSCYTESGAFTIRITWNGSPK